jgi:hypothetical protein
MIPFFPSVALVAILDASALHCPSPAIEVWAERLPGFAVHHARRFVVLSDFDEERARRVGRVLERTADAVEAFARESGRSVGTGFESDRVGICIAFADRTAFERFAREHDRVDAGWMMGYWVATDDRIVVRAESGPERRSRSGGHAGSEPAPCEEMATVAHEAAHQMLHRLGIQRRAPRMPLALLEGMAMQFETCADPTGTAGGDAFAPQPLRERRLRERPKATPSLRLLVTTPRLPSTDPIDIERFYDASWSLIRFLRQHDPKAFADYLANIAAEAETLTPERLVTIFERRFGPFEAMEAAWLRRLREAECGVVASGAGGRAEE